MKYARLSNTLCLPHPILDVHIQCLVNPISGVDEMASFLGVYNRMNDNLVFCEEISAQLFLVPLGM